MSELKQEKITDIKNDILEEIVKEQALEFIKACYQCGRCTGGCPSGRRTALRTRQVIRKALLGLDEVLQDPDIWLCTTCFTCYERCPRNLPVTDIIIKIRNLATQRGYMRDAHKSLTHVLIDTGHGVPIAEGEGGEKWRTLREAYGLDPLPPTTLTHPEAIEEIKKLVHILGFDDLVGYDNG